MKQNILTAGSCPTQFCIIRTLQPGWWWKHARSDSFNPQLALSDWQRRLGIPVGLSGIRGNAVLCGDPRGCRRNGIETQATELLCQFYPSNGMSDQLVYVYAGTAKSENITIDPDEVEEAAWFDQESVLRMLKTG